MQNKIIEKHFIHEKKEKIPSGKSIKSIFMPTISYISIYLQELHPFKFNSSNFHWRKVTTVLGLCRIATHVHFYKHAKPAKGNPCHVLAYHIQHPWVGGWHYLSSVSGRVKRRMLAASTRTLVTVLKPHANLKVSSLHVLLLYTGLHFSDWASAIHL